MTNKSMTQSDKEDMNKLIKQYKNALVLTNPKFGEKLHGVILGLYDCFLQKYEYDTQDGNIEMCRYATERMIPALRESIELHTSSIHDKIRGELFILHDKVMAFSARRNLTNFLLYMGGKLNVSLWRKQIPAFAGLIYYAEQMLWTDKIVRMIVAMPPSCGKSTFLNWYSAWILGQDMHNAILRQSYSDQLVRTASDTVKSLITTQAFNDVFPWVGGRKEKALYQPNTTQAWKIRGSRAPQNSFFAVTRDGQTTGFRIFFAMLDDMIKGVEEAQASALHDRMYQKFLAEVETRATDGKRVKAIVVGTMWSPNDLMNRLIGDVYDLDETKFKYTEISKNGSVVVVRIPAASDDGPTFPHIYDAERIEDLRKQLDQYFFSCVYMQRPIAQEGTGFDWGMLRTYNELPDGERGGVFAALDPARRGKNYVSLAISEKIGDAFYLTDFMHRKKAMSDLYEIIIEKLIVNNVSQFIIENNTDTSLKTLLLDKLKERGYTGIVVTERYETRNKEDRISNMQGYVRQNIVFPARSIYTVQTDMGRAMDEVTKFSFDYPNDYDDAIDAICLLCETYMIGKGKAAKAKAIRNILRM